MNVIFYITALISVIASIKVITSRDALNALVFLVITLLALASLSFSFHNNFVFACTFLIYALITAISQYFLIKKGFTEISDKKKLSPKIWFIPAVVCYCFIFILAYLFLMHQNDVPVPSLLPIQYAPMSTSAIVFLILLFLTFIAESVLLILFFYKEKENLFGAKFKMKAQKTNKPKLDKLKEKLKKRLKKGE